MKCFTTTFEMSGKQSKNQVKQQESVEKFWAHMTQKGNIKRSLILQPSPINIQPKHQFPVKCLYFEQNRKKLVQDRFLDCELSKLRKKGRRQNLTLIHAYP